MPLISIELAGEHHQGADGDKDDPMNDAAGLQLVSPGDIITRDVGFMRGHGTYMKDDDDSTAKGASSSSSSVLTASVAGVVQRVNKLISVTPLKTKYQCEIGDVVVGRITEVQQRRWKADINARLDASLLLSSVNLVGGELRRRSEQDELAMRKYLVEGDLISAEVQNLYNDGSSTLHTRSLKYGKLSQGTLVKVSPSLVKRRKTHFHKLPCGASVILGNNGFVWVSPTQHEEQTSTSSSDNPGSASSSGGGFTQNLTQVPRADREVVSRVRNCILALAENGVMLWDTTLIHAYDASMKFPLTDLLKKGVMREVADMTKQQIQMEA